MTVLILYECRHYDCFFHINLLHPKAWLPCQLWCRYILTSPLILAEMLKLQNHALSSSQLLSTHKELIYSKFIEERVMFHLLFYSGLCCGIWWMAQRSQTLQLSRKRLLRLFLHFILNCFSFEIPHSSWLDIIAPNLNLHPFTGRSTTLGLLWVRW